jgi:hypothetical protein
MNEDGSLKIVSSMILKERAQQEDQNQDGINGLGKMSHGRNLSGSFGVPETDEVAC